MRGGGRQRRRAARLQGQHAHARRLERTRELPECLLEQPPVAQLDHEIGADLGEQALGRALGPPHEAIALASDHDVEFGAHGQRLQRGAVAQDRILGHVEHEARAALGFGVQHRDHALHLVGRADGEHFAGLVDEAPVALLGALGGKDQTLRLGRQRPDVSHRILQRPRGRTRRAPAGLIDGDGEPVEPARHNGDRQQQKRGERHGPQDHAEACAQGAQAACFERRRHGPDTRAGSLRIESLYLSCSVAVEA